MTESEVIEWFKGFYNSDCERENFEATICADCNFPCRHGEPILMAIDALEEIQQYRALGTVEEIKAATKYLRLSKKHGTIGKVIDSCAEYESLGTLEELREAREKQKAKKPKLYGDFEDGKLLCPNCEEDLMDLMDCVLIIVLIADKP